MWDKGVSNMNEFLDKLNQFEKITTNSLHDLWKMKDLAFQPIKVRIDIQEYMPGLFDIIKPKETVELSKVMATFAYLQIETFNLKFEIE